MNVIDAPTTTPSAGRSSEGSDPRQATLVASLRARYAIAVFTARRSATGWSVNGRVGR